MLDRQAPDVEVVADCQDDIYDERTVNADAETEAKEHESHLVDVVTESRWPADHAAGNVLEQVGADTVDDAKHHRQNEDVAVGEGRLCQMRDNDLSDGVGVDETDVEDKGDEMVLENGWLQIEVDWYYHPSAKEWQEAEKCLASALAALSARVHDVDGAEVLSVTSLGVYTLENVERTSLRC